VAPPAPKPVAKPAPKPVAKPAPKPVAAPDTSSSSTCDEDTHYVNSSGHCVPRPVASSSVPEGATYKCKDGTYSFSEHPQGTCSGHKGIAQKL
jgi:hypothetical protein